MQKPDPGPDANIPQSLLQAVHRRLARNQRVRRTLPEKGRLHVDRQLPFLCVYRRPAGVPDTGTEQLVKGEAAYLVAPGAAPFAPQVSQLVLGLVEAMTEQFGAFLIVELWAAPPPLMTSSSDDTAPTIRLAGPPRAEVARTLDVLAQRLQNITVNKQRLAVEICDSTDSQPPDMAPLLSGVDATRLRCATIGVSVPPIYRDAASGHTYPVLLRQFSRSLSRALKQAFYEFAHSQTTHRPPHFHELGRRAVVKAVWEVDRQLSDVSNAFDFLLQLTPVNSDEAWQAFQQSGFRQIPQFRYLPIPFDPPLLKRQLYRIPVERVEDPALQHIFLEKQLDLDRKISMLAERDTPRFLYGSLQLYGTVSSELLQLARRLLQRTVPDEKLEGNQRLLGARAFATRAELEFAHYRKLHAGFLGRTEITRRVAGILVSRGRLLCHPNIKVAAHRVDAVLQHEVGTHMLSYFNGRAQPFRQLYCGLAGYEATQEGLAVLAEYLAGGLDRSRLRQLAARVVVAAQCLEGASFVDAWAHLREQAGFSERNAFKNAMRVYRGGGLTKDVIYLQGLRQLLSFLGRGGDLRTLLAGRFAISHLGIIQELLHRQILFPPPALPRYLDNPRACQRLKTLAARVKSAGPKVLDLIIAADDTADGMP